MFRSLTGREMLFVTRVSYGITCLVAVQTGSLQQARAMIAAAEANCLHWKKQDSPHALRRSMMRPGRLLLDVVAAALRNAFEEQTLINDNIYAAARKAASQQA